MRCSQSGTYLVLKTYLSYCSSTLLWGKTSPIAEKLCNQIYVLYHSNGRENALPASILPQDADCWLPPLPPIWGPNFIRFFQLFVLL